MKLYEGLFVFPPEATTDARKTQLKNVEDLIAKLKGKVIQKAEWGKKPLGYAVKKFREGHVVIMDYQMDSLKQTEFRNALQLQDDLVKFMITVKDTKAEKKKSENASKAAAKTVAPSVPSAASTR